MALKPVARSNSSHRRALLGAASAASLASILSADPPAHAQLRNMAAALGHSVNIAAPNVQSVTARSVVSPSMAQIQARQAAYRARISQQANIVSSANAATRAAAQAAAQTVPNGLTQGGLVPVANRTTSSLDTSGLRVWQGASTPAEIKNGNFVDVTINQTQSRALLSWESFNVGRDTTLTFNQQGHSDWVVVNRVVGGINPATGRLDPNLGPTPSQILGKIKADGTVYVLNRSGVLFGATSQVNLHSLVASTLELGTSTIPTGNTITPTRTLSLAERNDSYLQNGILSGASSGLLGSVTGETHGAVTLAQGGQINSTGGFVILAAPQVSSGGEIKTSVGGQVSLEAGNQVDAYSSTGGASSIDPNVRGLVLTSVGGGSVDVSGSIDAPQGYISLGTDQTGSVSFSGILTSTTSVSRNGKISLTGGTVDIEPNAAISILPDSGSETIPISPDSVSAFKTSQIDIGSHYYQLDQGKIISGSGGAITDLLPSSISIGKDATIQAPSANVNIGGTASGRSYSMEEGLITSSKVDIASGAVIDVSGITDWLLDASRNQLVIDPAKRNELRDTPTYRDETTDGSFSLNGQTLYLDPRISGVRSDGVAWIGSPLVEAASLAEQIGVTASELMTKGGNVTLSTLTHINQPSSGSSIPGVTIAKDAAIDFAGGWVRYQDGFIRSSKLITRDGRVVDISAADPNDVYVALANGFVENLPQLSNPRVYANIFSNIAHFEAGYAEGRDAGSLTIKAPSVKIDSGARLHGEAVAGTRQINDAKAATANSSLSGDVRKLQTIGTQLPASGLLHIQSVLGGDIQVGGTQPTDASVNYISADTINNTKLSGLSLQTSGKVTFAANSTGLTDGTVTLADGGVLNVDSGRSINFDGTVSAAGGSITARTYGDRFGSIFTSVDDLPLDSVATATTLPGMFDIIVNDGAMLSTRGRWVNDSLVTDGNFLGGGYTSGGSITLNAAPHVALFTDTAQTKAIDLSGSIELRSKSLLDVSGGGYISPTGALSLNGKGGNVSLIDETVYFQLQQTDTTNTGSLSGQSLFRSDITTLNVTPVPGAGFSSAIIPDTINAHVSIADGTIRGFGFEGGGTFKLVTPDLRFGSSSGTGTAIPLDFLQKTGFGTLDLTAWNTTLIDSVFSNGRTGKSAIASTEQLRVNAGETLNLTQSILPSVLTQAQIDTVRSLATGMDVSRVSALAPTNALGDYDNLAAHLVLGGLTELDILGGTITGAPGATITTPKLYNDGTIKIAGGTISQTQTLPVSYNGLRSAIGIHAVADSDGVDRGAGFSVVFGQADNSGKFDELATNALGITDSATGAVLTNRELVAGYQTDRSLYYLGQLDADQGLLFSSNSVTDLSGTSIFNPRAPVLANGTRLATGRIIDGGSIKALGTRTSQSALFSASPFPAVSYLVGSSTGVYIPQGSRNALRIDTEPYATINLSGASATFDLQTTSAAFTPTVLTSNGGTLLALGGGNVTGATIKAKGGGAQALGGTIEWLNPTLTQANTPGTVDTLSADQIMSAGFSSFIARGALDTLGTVDLSLGRSFLLMSPDFLGTSTPGTDYYHISIASHGDLTIIAPHIGLLSSDPTVGSLPSLFTQSGGPDQLLLKADSIDIAGGVALGASFDRATFDATRDIRFIGVAPVDRTFIPGSSAAPSLTGGLVVAGDLTLRAAQVYATTGTGNLQQLLEDPTAKPSPFVIASLGGLALGGSTVGKTNATIRIESNGGAIPNAPLSAGSYLSIVAPNIEQAGVLRAPLGRIDLGSRAGQLVTVGSTVATVTTSNLTLENGSLTSVSAKGLTIPYGTTTDLTEYYFSPSVTSPLTREPAAQLSLGGNNIVTGASATVDASGGGDIYAYEFVSGTGGSRDMLSRFNSDAFSSNNGYQYADGRQVYAIVPTASAASVALFDPIYSGDYGALYGADVGKTVHLDAAPGVAAGEYILLPAKYALLPGAMRLVENTGAPAPIAGNSTRLLDGSIVVGGAYGVSDTSYVETQRRSFTIQDQATFKSYSRIETTSGNTSFSVSGNGARLARDAARIVLDPLTTLHIGSAFNTAGGNGGRGSQVDILGDVLTIVSSLSGTPGSGGTELAVDDLARLNADSLLIGGTRTELADGSTDIRVTANSITVANDAAHPLSAPEIILAVDGAQSTLNIADGASIVATGTLTDTRTTDYNVASYTLDSSGNPVGVNSGAGAVLRLANGAERLINRSGALAASVTSKPVGFNIGTAILSGNSLALDSSRNLTIDTLSSIDVQNLALSGDNIAFSSRTFGVSGLVITPELEQSFSSINHITLRSPKVIGFTPGSHQFNNMYIDAPGVRVLNPTAGQPQQPLTVQLDIAGEFKIGNSSSTLGCTASGTTICQSSGNSLVVNADTLRFGSGTFRTYNFDASVALNATSGAYYEGTGVFDVGSAALSLTTPFLVDRGTGEMPSDKVSVQADLTLLTSNALTISAQSNNSSPGPNTPLAPGARLALGSLANPIHSVSIDSTLLRATAGAIDIKAQNDISLIGTAKLSTPNYSQQFGDAADAVTVSAGGGTVALLSKTGNIDLGASSTLDIGGATGKAGSLKLIAAQGLVTMGGTINAAAPKAGASFTLDNGLGSFDFAAFVSNFGSQFTGDVAIRTGAGDLALNAGQKFKLDSIDLNADGGSININGTIDTSGINGGDIALYGMNGVSLGSTALLDSHSDGYADTDTRQASAGDITLGIGQSGSISVASGAKLDLGTRRLGDRLIAHQQVDPTTHNQITAYTFVEADKGGQLLLRAPVISQTGGDSVNIDFAGTATGALDVTIEGYRSYDLASVANDPNFSGVTVANGTATIDVGASSAGKLNFFADKGAGTLVDFIQNFDISSANANLGILTSHANFHEKAGVELTYSGDIVLASNWNLGAGSINIASALADGDMRLSALGPNANGTPRYEVVPGREAHLFQNHVSMLYRTGGTVDGEAGILTLRAGGNLDLQHSITDGFFAFSDQTDPDYISYQLGGRQRSYQPSINISCGKNDCANVIDFALDTQGKVTLPPKATSIDITLSKISAGQETFLIDGAPYSAAANAAAPTGLQAGGAGDPLGSAQLFPLLADGSAADSFGIRLVGGTGASTSANPLHVDAASNGSMILQGESSYTLAAVKPTAIYSGDVQLDFGNSGNYLKGNIFQDFALQSGIDPASLLTKTTHVQFGAASSAAVQFLRQEALAYFANYPNEVQFVTGTKNGPITGFAAPFDRFVQFLMSTDTSGQTILQRFGALISNGSFGYNNPQPRGKGLNPTADTVYVRSLVRTGTGTIDVAAAADVDLRNGANLMTRNANGGNNAAAGGLVTQVGGTAIYTAGHVVNPSVVQARLAGTSTLLSVDPTAYLPQADPRSKLWVPDNTGRLQTNPVFATGGGSISVAALNDVLGRRDVWSESQLNPAGGTVTIGGIDHSLAGLNMIGTGDQRWRVGDMGGNGLATTIRINAQQFSSGLGTLGGGDITVSAGNDARELTIALDTTVATGDVGTSFGSMVFGGGDLDVIVGHDIAGGRFDIATGVANLKAGGDIGSSGLMTLIPQKAPLSVTQVENLPEIRLTDTVASLKAGGSISLGKITALGTNNTESVSSTTPVIDENALGYYTGNSAVMAQSFGDFSIAGGPVIAQVPNNTVKVLPSTLDVTSLGGNIDLGTYDNFLYPSITGQLSLLAAGTLNSWAINLDDSDPSLLPGIFSANSYDNVGDVIFGRRFTLPVTLPNTSDADRRLYHNAAITHANDLIPARIAVGGDLTNLTLFLSKQGRISAGRDIVNMVFTGQNLAATHVTRIVAGRDITATTTRTAINSSFAPGRGLVQGNTFALGGSGAFYLEAGRNMGPFLNSATITNVSFDKGQPVFNPGTANYAGGIFAVGNDYNPWLAPKSADLYAFFGIGPGMDFVALREAYVNPANTAALDGDLFEQNVDIFGNKSPDRTRPIYSPILITWMQESQAAALINAFGTTNVTAAQAYTAFAALPDLVQRSFLLDKVYFNELAAPSRPDGNSYLQYIRGYRAVETLFPAALGYTANDLSGAGNGGTRVKTGNLDLRLAAIETTRDSNITILGPGGDAILGSVVRTSTQAAGRAYQPQVYGLVNTAVRPTPSDLNFQALAIPIGYEGVLSLRGGAINGFTDGDFRLNQSRLFAQQSGNITLWSSNGDLNAGQGPKSAANVPPIVLRFNPNGGSEVDSASGVVGAGIAGFAGIRRLDLSTGQFVLADVLNDSDVAEAEAQLSKLPAGSQITLNSKTYIRDVPSVTLIAPVGTIDAGDAGVRASGDIFVAAAHVANADNFKVGGTAVGIPAVTAAPAPATPASAASAAVANLFRGNDNNSTDQRSRITVDVLGVYNFNDQCVDEQGNPKDDCKTNPQ